MACRYPPINKRCVDFATYIAYIHARYRGIPSGYISFIEQRLLETEFLCLELLSAIYNSKIVIEQHTLSDHERRLLAGLEEKQPKSAKIQEWKSFPLATDEQRRNWWRKKRESIVRSDGNDHFQNSPARSDALAGISPLPDNFDDMHVTAAISSQTHMIQQTTPPISTWESAANASSLSNSTFSLEDHSQTFVDTIPMDSSIPDDLPNDASAESAGHSGYSSPLHPHGLNVDRWRKYF